LEKHKLEITQGIAGFGGAYIAGNHTRSDFSVYASLSDSPPANPPASAVVF
jgi:hypothetical protein